MNTDTVNEDGRNLPAVADAPALPQRDFRAGTAALAEMPEREFQERLTSMQRGRDRLKAIHFDLMTAKTDYDVIPGTAKPSLLKSGAEKLLHFYRLACEFVPGISYGDGEALPWISVVTECRLHVGDLEGPVVNTGHGAANSWEKRYRRGGGDVAAAHWSTRRCGPPQPVASTRRIWKISRHRQNPRRLHRTANLGLGRRSRVERGISLSRGQNRLL